jgi:trk system potassium uptake protein TrkH
LRQTPYLRKRYQAILSYTGAILLMGAGLMLSPLVMLIFWHQEWRLALPGFVLPSFALGLLGAFLWKYCGGKDRVVLTVEEGGVIVVLSWFLVCLASSWPFIVLQGLGFSQAVFESVSGWTTTGLSVVDVTRASHLILIWRSIMQLAGGAGLAIIMIAAIAGPIGPGLSVAEGRSEQLVPQVRASAKIVTTIYAGYAAIGSIALWLAGMEPFDALNHAFAAISTGGFSTRPESIGYWDSVAIEAAVIPLMILGNLNFLTAYLLLQGRLRAVLRNGEVRLMAVLLPAFALICFWLVCKSLYPTFDKQARVAIFEVASALTTTGFSTVSYGNWNGLGFLLLIVLMLIGGGTCSTAGGIKQYRIFVLFKSFVWDLRRAFLPRTAVVESYVWRGEQQDFLTEARIRKAAIFCFVYLTVYTVGTAVLAAHGYSLQESLFEFASAIGTIGLSVGVTAASSPPLVLWAESCGMFLGRLEFFVIIISVIKIFKDVPTMLHRER